MTSRAAAEVVELLECVVNVSEGRDGARLRSIGSAVGDVLLDVHRDPDHHRSVFTLAGPAEEVERAARRLARAVVDGVDIGPHSGAHPRLGVLDVVPWIHLVRVGGRLRDGRIQVATEARDRFARWAATELDLPCFLYGPSPTPGAAPRTLPQLRRHAWRDNRPDLGPPRPHPTAGATCVGARPVLVAYNLWLEAADVNVARRVAGEIRSPQLRTLGLQVGDAVQVSCNLIAPWTVGPEAAFDAVASRVEVERAELVGLLPLGVLDAIPSSRWPLLDVGPSKTIEARLRQAGLDGGRFGKAPPDPGGHGPA
jgi:glutamate formiminotransferase